MREFRLDLLSMGNRIRKPALPPERRLEAPSMLNCMNEIARATQIDSRELSSLNSNNSSKPLHWAYYGEPTSQSLPIR